MTARFHPLMDQTLAMRLQPVGAALALATLLTLAAAAPPAGAQTFTVFHTFTGSPDGQVPFDGLVLDTAGNLYGTTSHGGDERNCRGVGCGTVFKVDTIGTETVLREPWLEDSSHMVNRLVQEQGRRD